MKTLMLIFLYIACGFSQNSSGFTTGALNNWVKSNTTSPFVLGRANTGIGEQFKNKINYLNTASWANSNLTLFDINIMSSRSSIDLNDVTASLSGTQLGSLAWVTSALDSTLAFGITFSSLYENSSKSSILISQETDSGTFEIGDKLFENVGNVNQIKIGSSYQVSKKYSFGLDLLYYQGNLKIDERQQFISSSAFTTSQKLDEMLTTYIGFSAGLSFSANLFDDRLHLGTTYSPEKTLATSAKRVFKSGASTSLNTENDIPADAFIVPARFGVGAHLETNFGHLFTDFRYEGGTDRSKSSKYVSVGFQTNPSKQLFESFLKRSTYTLGTYYYTENFDYNNSDVINYGASAGMSIPFNFNTKELSLGLSYGKRGDNSKNGLSESVFKFSIGLSIGEFWYITAKEN